MLESMYTALTGLKAQQTRIDVIGGNIANIGTTAYKGSRADFADALYGQIQKPIQSGNYLQYGTGILVNAVQQDGTLGVPQATGNTLDFMLTGQGYFTVQDAAGNTYYTRDGAFHVSMEAGGNYLVTANGDYVLGSNNQRIRVPGDSTAVTCDGTGLLKSGGAAFATLKLVSFTNPAGLAAAGGNRFTATAASGAMTTSDSPVLQGFLEGSNVDMANEMTNLMVAQKAYAAMGSIINTADQMDSLANSMSR